jgi:hypothetical protein
MKKILVALAILFGSITAAAATCSGPAVMHDFAGSPFNMSLATNAGDGNCAPNTTIVGSLPAFASPPAVTQSGTWNIGSITTLPALVAGSAIVGKVGIDQTTVGTTNGVSIAQVGANTVAAGNGTSGTGNLRVNIASDNSPVAGLGAGATGSAPPANAINNGATSSGNLTGLIACDSSIVYDASTNGSTQLVGLTSGQTIYVCGYSIGVGAVATNVKLTYGTGTACASGTTSLTPAYQFAANGGVTDRSPFYSGMKTAVANELCINTSAGNPVQAVVYYTKF